MRVCAGATAAPSRVKYGYDAMRCTKCGANVNYHEPTSWRWWDEWRGALDGRPVMWIKRLVSIPVGYSFKRGKVLSVRLDLHKMVRPDDKGCFHSHPAWAIRFPFWAGYVEEIYRAPLGDWPKHDFFEFDSVARMMRYWWPLSLGLVKPGLIHRVHRLLGEGASYSLWLRGPVVADVELHGDGWPPEKRGAHPERN